MAKILFREHKSTLSESLTLMKEFDSSSDFIKYCENLGYEIFGYRSRVTIKDQLKHSKDVRINWESNYIVLFGGYPIGYMTYNNSIQATRKAFNDYYGYLPM